MAEKEGWGVAWPHEDKKSGEEGGGGQVGKPRKGKLKRRGSGRVVLVSRAQVADSRGRGASGSASSSSSSSMSVRAGRASDLPPPLCASARATAYAQGWAMGAGGSGSVVDAAAATPGARGVHGPTQRSAGVYAAEMANLCLRAPAPRRAQGPAKARAEQKKVGRAG